MNGPYRAEGAVMPRVHHGRAIAGFTLVESLIALSILALVFTAIASAIGAGSASAGEARESVAATLASDELLAEVLASEWDDMTRWDGYQEDAGENRAPDGARESARKAILRSIAISKETVRLEPSGIEITGRRVLIRAEDPNSRILVQLDRFVPQPTEQAQ